MKVSELFEVKKPNMRGVEDELKAHADSKIAHEKKYGPMSGADLHSHEVRRKALLKKLNRERSKANLAEGADNTKHMESELQEGWKGAVAGAAVVGAVAAGIGTSPKVEINGHTYDKAVSSAPATAKSATVSINGKKKSVKYWDATGPKGRVSRVYAIDKDGEKK